MRRLVKEYWWVTFLAVFVPLRWVFKIDGLWAEGALTLGVMTAIFLVAFLWDRHSPGDRP